MLLLEHHVPKDLYEVLGVKRTAKLGTIKRAYKRLSKIHHPDSGGDPEAFRRINEAYETLSDPKKKFIYDTVDFGPEELRNAVELIISQIINGIAKGKVSQRSLRSYISNFIGEEIQKIDSHCIDLHKGTALVRHAITLIEPSSYISELAIEKLEAAALKNEQIEKDGKKKIEFLKKALKLVDMVMLLQKEDVQIWQTTTTSNSSATGTGQTMVFRMT